MVLLLCIKLGEIMEKYISEIVKAEDVIVSTERIWDAEQHKHFNVMVEHTPTGIIVIESFDKSQLEAYNRCIERIEFIIKFKEFRDKYKDRPDLFAEEFLGIKLLPHQKLMLKVANFKNYIIMPKNVGRKHYKDMMAMWDAYFKQ